MLLTEELVADVYTPSEQSDELRPLVMMAHGGFFLGGSNDGLDVVSLCEDLARMGYVTASFSYRLGIDNLFDFQTSFVEAVWRGVHDSRAAVRFFRKSVEMGNPYHIDPERIYLGGVSAGGFIAMHHAYVDEESEIPTYIDESEPGLGGGLEGLSGNEGYSSDIHGVFNIAGALQTADFLLLGDNEPLVSIHGTADETVPYAEGEIVFTGIPIIDVDGSSIIHAMADSVGLDNCLIPVEGAGHVPHIFDATYYDLTLSTVAGKLGEWACDGYVPVCGGYDYTAETSISKRGRHVAFVVPQPCKRPRPCVRVLRRPVRVDLGQCAWCGGGTRRGPGRRPSGVVRVGSRLVRPAQRGRKPGVGGSALTPHGVQVHASCAALKVFTWACTTVFTSGE